MKAKKFKHADTMLGGEGYSDLPAVKFRDEEGTTITCWTFSFWERIRILFGKPLWLSTLTFNRPFQPIYLSVNRKNHYSIINKEPYFTKKRILWLIFWAAIIAITVVFSPNPMDGKKEVVDFILFAIVIMGSIILAFIPTVHLDDLFGKPKLEDTTISEKEGTDHV